MNRILFALAVAGIAGLAGCQGGAMATKPEMAAQPAKPALSEDASKALAQAQTDVKNAQAHKALWTTSADALKKAEEAAAKGDSAAVIKDAKVASEHAKIAIEQTHYPITQ